MEVPFAIALQRSKELELVVQVDGKILKCHAFSL